MKNIALQTLILATFFSLQASVDNYKYIELNTENYKPTLKAPVQIKPIDSINVKFDLPGTIDKIYVSEGQKIHIGEKIASVSKGFIDAQIKEHQNDLSKLRHEYVMRGDKLAQKQYYETQNKIKELVLLKQKTKIHAKSNGIIGKIKYPSGTRILPSDVLTTIEDFSQVKLVIKPKNESMSLLKEGMPVTLYTGLKKGDTIKTKLEFHNSQPLIYLNNEKNKLIANYNIIADIDIPEQKNVILINKENVARNKYILLKNENRIIKFYLSKYSMDNNFYIIYEELPSYTLAIPN